MKQIIISRYDNDILTVGIDTFHFYCLYVSFYIDNIVMLENTLFLIYCPDHNHKAGTTGDLDQYFKLKNIFFTLK